MPKTIKKTDKKASNKVKKVKGVDEEVELELEDDEPEEPAHETVVAELDPEILAALNAKKKKKAGSKEIDYVAEFERGDIDDTLN